MRVYRPDEYPISRQGIRCTTRIMAILNAYGIAAHLVSIAFENNVHLMLPTRVWLDTAAKIDTFLCQTGYIAQARRRD